MIPIVVVSSEVGVTVGAGARTGVGVGVPSGVGVTVGVGARTGVGVRVRIGVEVVWSETNLFALASTVVSTARFCAS